MKKKLQELFSEYSLTRISDTLLNCVKPSVRIRLVDDYKQEIEIGTSKFGGCPDLPRGTVWPVWKDTPLSFIGQFDLSEVSKFQIEDTIPKEGMLFFFYDAEQSTWGYDPEDRESWKVFYFDVEKTDLIRTQFPKELPLEAHYKEWPVEFHQDSTLPPWDSDVIDELRLSDEEDDDYIEFLPEIRNLAFESETVHRLFGYPDQVHNDMQLECQLVSNGLYCGNPSGYEDPRAVELQEGAKDWRLLLQIDSDQSVGMCWGDLGRLYFWIKVDDLKNGNFNDVWTILQC